jgi:hypothetical protein
MVFLLLSLLAPGEKVVKGKKCTSYSESPKIRGVANMENGWHFNDQGMRDKCYGAQEEDLDKLGILACLPESNRATFELGLGYLVVNISTVETGYRVIFMFKNGPAEARTPSVHGMNLRYELSKIPFNDYLGFCYRINGNSGSANDFEGRVGHETVTSGRSSELTPAEWIVIVFGVAVVSTLCIAIGI